MTEGIKQAASESGSSPHTTWKWLAAVVAVASLTATCGEVDADNHQAAGGAGAEAGSGANGAVGGVAGNLDSSADGVAPDSATDVTVGPDTGAGFPGVWPDSLTTACIGYQNPQAPYGGSSPEPCEPGGGQDGNYAIVPPQYSASSDVVNDLVTGWTWQRGLDPVARTWPEAETYCATLSLDGHGDWRLPHLIELISLLDFGHAKSASAIPEPFVKATTSLWSGTQDKINPNGAWFVDASDGSIWRSPDTAQSRDVRCIYGPKASGQFLVNPDGLTVVHTMTGLTWQRGSQSDSGVSCEALTLAGHDDWRMPNAKELWTLFDETAETGLINPDVFLGSGPRQFWSSTPVLYEALPYPNPETLMTFTHAANFDNGQPFTFLGTILGSWAERAKQLSVRCVRSET